MFKKLLSEIKDKIKDNLKKDENRNVTPFSESPLKTSFYEELQKNGWAEIILEDTPKNLINEMKEKYNF